MEDKFNKSTKEIINSFIISFQNVFPNIYTTEEIEKLIYKNLNFDIEYSSDSKINFEYNPYLKILTINKNNLTNNKGILFKSFIKVISTKKNKIISSGLEENILSETNNQYINNLFLDMFENEYLNKLNLKNNSNNLNIIKQMNIVLKKESLIDYLTNINKLKTKFNKRIKLFDYSLKKLNESYNKQANNGIIFQQIGEVENFILSSYQLENKKEDEILNDLNELIKLSINPNLDKYYDLIKNTNIDNLNKYTPLYEIYNSIQEIKNNNIEEVIKNNKLKNYKPLEIYLLKNILNIKLDYNIIDPTINYFFSHDLDIELFTERNKYESYELYNKFNIYKQLLILIEEDYLKKEDIKKLNIKYSSLINYEIDINGFTNNNYLIENCFENNIISITNNEKSILLKFDEKDTYIYEKKDIFTLMNIYSNEYLNKMIDENIEVFYNKEADNYIFCKEDKIINNNDLNGNLVLNEHLSLLKKIKIGKK